MSYQPTIIGVSLIKTEPKKVYEPTKISVAEPQITTKKFEVTAMKGHVRKSLDPSKYDLENQFPTLWKTNIEKLKLEISGIVLDVLDRNHCENIGKSIQLEFASMLIRIFKLSESTCIEQAQRHVERLTTILSDAIQSLEHGNGFLWKKTDAKEVLTSVTLELNLLKSLLATSSDAINLIRTEASSYSGRLLAMENEILIYSSLIKILEDEVSDELMDILLQRGISIETTKVQISNQIKLMCSMIVSLTSLIDMIQDSINVHLPGLLQVIMTAMQSDMNDTQKYLITDSLKTFITSLKKDIS
ncbi:MAG TPA: hypothetical protein VFM18_14930 [Methanosarcina sp.]|nr:hypothetical protein [Methanosarcina sp.]